MRHDLIVTSQCKHFVALVVYHARRFFSPIDVSRFQGKNVVVSVWVNVFNKQYRSHLQVLNCFVLLGIRRAFVGWLSALLPVRHQTRFRDDVEGTSVRFWYDLDASFYAFFDNCRGRAIYHA